MGATGGGAPAVGVVVLVAVLVGEESGAGMSEKPVEDCDHIVEKDPANQSEVFIKFPICESVDTAAHFASLSHDTAKFEILTLELELSTTEDESYHCKLLNGKLNIRPFFFSIGAAPSISVWALS